MSHPRCVTGAHGIQRCTPRTQSSCRRAFSLLEVIVGTGILASSTILLLSLFSTGERHGRRAEQRVTAQLLCQSKLDELLAEPSRLRSVEEELIAGSSGWTWSADWEPTELAGLVRVHLSVARFDDISESAAELGAIPHRPEFELVRWMRYDEDSTEPTDEDLRTTNHAVFVP